MKGLEEKQKEEEEKAKKEAEAKERRAEKARQSVVKEFKHPEVLERKPGEDDAVINQLAKPKDHHQKKKELLKLQKQFPHDRTLQKMVELEFQENRIFRYPEEYEVFNAEEQKAIFMKSKKMDTRDLADMKEAENTMRDKFRATDKIKQNMEGTFVRTEKQRFNDCEQDILQRVETYKRNLERRMKMADAQEEKQTI